MNFIGKILKSHSKEDADFYHQLKSLLNFKPVEISYYKKAFTHSSSKVIDKQGIPVNYERLEFLGDAILGAIVASYLYREVPKATEGYLTKMRSKIVSRKYLNNLGKELDLMKYVKNNIVNKGLSENVYGNIFEALLGAIHLDRGYDYCEKFVYYKLITPYVNIPKLEGKITSYKSLIIEWCQKHKKPYAFKSYQDTGNEPIRHFSVKVNVGDIVAKARATSKKKAQELAARRIYYILQKEIKN